MIEQVKAGDKITVIKVSDLASTSISEITIDSIQNGRIVFARKRKKYYLNIDSGTLVLNGHNLGITRGTWNDGASCYLMDANCNIGGLDRESMITLLKTNINNTFNQWNRIYWFDGTSDKGDPIFEPRPTSDNYLKYREQAEKNKPKTAQQINVGEFIYSYSKSSKHNNLTDMLRCHLEDDMESKESVGLGKVVDIVEISEEDFDALEYGESGNFLKDRGGDYSDDIAEDRDFNSLSSFEMETYYSHLTLIRTPSGRAIIADAQGSDYMRYTSLLPHYRISMNADCEKINEILRLEKETAEQERIEKKQEEARLGIAEIARITKEYPYLTVVAVGYDKKTVANNLRKVLKTMFPQTKFSVTNDCSNSYGIRWIDGPPANQVDEIAKLFKGEGFDGMTDSSYKIRSPFMNRYGALGYVSTSRKISEPHRIEALDAINKEMGTSYAINDYVAEKEEYMAQLVYKRICHKDYSPKLEANSTPSNQEESNSPTVKAEGVKIVDYSEKSFAIIGDTKSIKETIKELGGRFNRNLTCGPGWIFQKSKLDAVKQRLSLI